MPQWKFGCLRRLPSGWQPGDASLDGRPHTSSETLETAFDVGRWLATTPRPSSWVGATENFDEPPRVSPLGVLVDIEGLLGPKVDSDRPVRWLCTYLADTYPKEHVTRAGLQPRVDRLSGEFQTLPCLPGSVKGRRYGACRPRVRDSPGPAFLSGARPEEPGPRQPPGLATPALVRPDAAERRALRRAVVTDVLGAAGIDPATRTSLPQARRRTRRCLARRRPSPEVLPGRPRRPTLPCTAMAPARREAKSRGAQGSSLAVDSHSAITHDEARRFALWEPSKTL